MAEPAYTPHIDEPSELGCDTLELFSDVVEDNELSGKYLSDMELEEPLNQKIVNKPINTYSKPIADWTAEDILNWICKQFPENYEDFPLGKFRTITVNEFRNMTIDEFLTLVENVRDAEYLYMSKEQLFASCTNKNLQNWTNTDIMEWICELYDKHNMDYETNLNLKNFKSVNINSFAKMSIADLSQLMDSNWEHAKFLHYWKTKLFYPHIRITSDSCLENKNPCPSNETLSENSLEILTNGNNMEPVRIRKRGRPCKPVNRHVRRTGKLWEFLIKLLMDGKTCPSLIKWENYKEGTFKFVKNTKVAELWGARKRNGNMNFEKFSRAMRYYYRKNILQPVPGQRLVYKFGPNATGWQNRQPIL